MQEISANMILEPWFMVFHFSIAIFNFYFLLASKWTKFNFKIEYRKRIENQIKKIYLSNQ